MEGIKIDCVDYSDHQNKCRICFKPFGVEEHRVDITRLVERKFREITQTDLKSSDDVEYSKQICVVCNFQLKDFCVFRKNVILLQKGLHKFTGRLIKIETLNEESQDGMMVKTESDNFYEDVDYECEKLEPEVKISNDEPQSEFLDFTTHFDQTYEELESDGEGQDENGSSVETFKCQYCNIELTNQHLLDEHERTIHEEFTISREFQCDQCDFKSSSKGSLRSHQRKLHADNKMSFQCSDCPSFFESYQSFYNHKVKMHTSDKDRTKWVCQYCNTSFSGSRTLRDHITILHATVKPQIPCPVKTCTKVFLTTKRLRAHIKVHDDDSKEQCNVCGLLVTNRHNLEKHVKRVHLKLRNFFCDVCGYSSTFKHSIASHMVSHIDPNERRKWKCDSCSFVSVSAQSLRAHKSYEHSGKVYTCHCGKQFNQRASLSTHIKCVHHKIKDHLCNLCGKAYFTRKDLQNHKKSQHMEKDMPCEICGKLFATTKHLTRHRMYHEDPKYKCQFEGCLKAFIDNAKLKDHMKLHEGNRDHLCHLCEKAYFHQKDLKRHLDVAHKQTIFYCEICTFTISRKDYLRNHLNSAHKHLSLEEKNEIMARTKVTRNVV